MVHFDRNAYIILGKRYAEAYARATGATNQSPNAASQPK
jgi:hypothetical protein